MTTTRRYAQRTEVPVERSKAEIERLLMRYGATKFVYGVECGRAMVMFQTASRQIRFILPLPETTSFNVSPAGRRRTQAQAAAACAQETRRRWRALCLTITAKLEAVESGISQFDDEFLAFIVLPNGRTVREAIIPQMDAYIAGRALPPLIPNVEESQ